MTEIKTVLLQGFFTESRRVQCDFVRTVYQDGVEILRSDRPHTVAFDPDADHDAILSAINADITTREGMQWPAIDAGEWARAVAHCAVEHTPEVKAAYAAFKQSAASAAITGRAP